MKKVSPAAAFSLVELTLALGVAAFCLIAVFGLIPVGMQTNRNATSQTIATNIIASIAADLRSTGTTGNSPEFCIGLGATKTMYFEREARCSSDIPGLKDCCTGASTGIVAVKTRYRATVTFPSTGSLVYADIKVSWPAEAIPANAAGSVETLMMLDRN
jgi:hypothetical protein